jgi:hypothetical protein
MGAAISETRKRKHGVTSMGVGGCMWASAFITKKVEGVF